MAVQSSNLLPAICLNQVLVKQLKKGGKKRNIILQEFSSLLSPQSSSWSQIKARGMHSPLAHWNCVLEHPRAEKKIIQKHRQKICQNTTVFSSKRRSINQIFLGSLHTGDLLQLASSEESLQSTLPSHRWLALKHAPFAHDNCSHLG